MPPTKDTVNPLTARGEDFHQFPLVGRSTLLAVTHEGTRELMVWDLRLLREELARMGMDWYAPPYPPLPNDPTHKTVHFRVRTNSLPQAVRAG